MKVCWSTFAHFCNPSANFQGNLKSIQACRLGIYFHKAATLRLLTYHSVVEFCL